MRVESTPLRMHTCFPMAWGTWATRWMISGLTFGLWVAPFQVSERSWVYEHHKDWLVHNQSGELIHIGKVHGKNSDEALRVGYDPSWRAGVSAFHLYHAD